MSWLLPRLIYWFYRIISFTWRIQLNESPSFVKQFTDKTPLILAHWHGDEVALLHLVPRYKIATMISKSNDGETMNYLVHRLGGVTSRGSSSRGAISALKGLIRLGRLGHVMSVAVDGPRGPRHEPKQGVFELSRLCKAEIFSMGVVCPKKFTFEKSWNKIYIPHPFSRVYIHVGEPISALTINDDPKDMRYRHELKSALYRAEQHAGKIIADPHGGC